MNALQFMTLFEQVTHAALKDCIIADDVIVFIVEPGEIAKAIGKGGQNARFLEKKTGKRVRIVEYHNDLLTFINNLAYPVVLKDAREQDGIVVLQADMTGRGQLIGRSATNLRLMESIVKRYFPIKEIKIP